jgi:hypothetical protein
MTGTEDWCFHEYFGTGVAAAIHVWTFLTETDLLPESAEISHLLWAVYFLKCYPRIEEGCAAAASKSVLWTQRQGESTSGG